MKVLVTGGAGFIGSNFVLRTLNTYPNYSVTVLDSLTYAGSLENLSKATREYEFVQGDIRDKQLVMDAVAGHDLVVHFAAESHNDNSLLDPEPFISTNISGTANLISAAVTHDIRFHHISTDEVFGDLPLGRPERFTEDSPYRPSSPYSASKAASDHLVRAWVRSFGLKATITNCSNNFGPNQHSEKLIPNTILKVLRGERPTVYGAGANVRDWIHVDDHTDGVWAAINRGKLGETYLLGANNEVDNLSVVRLILHALGKKPDFIEFVSDRPGHDLRYAIDPSKANSKLGWFAKRTNFVEELRLLATHYQSCDAIQDS
jgi:dTDP-glucose 4,6-dehydratase